MEIKNKGLFALTIPIFLELLLMTVVGNIDILMVSRYSDTGVGVLGAMSQVMHTQNVIFSFISIGTGILTAQYLGAKNIRKIDEVISVSLLLNLIMGVLLGAIYMVFSTLILTKIKLTPDLVEIGKNYFKIVGGLGVFQALTVTASASLRSYGYTKEPLYINIVINLINVIGNGMFLFGWMGMPILGVTGVGIATVTARLVGMLITLYTLGKLCHYRYSWKKLLVIPRDVLGYMARIGVPSGMEHLSWNLAQVVILSMVNTMGTQVITARTYLNLIASFMMMFSIALGHGTAILTGRYIGEKNLKKAHDQCIKSLKMSLVAVTLVSIVVLVFQNPILSYFTKDQEIIDICKKVLWLFLIIEPGRTFNIVIINSLHAAGDVKFPMIMGIIFMFGIAVSLSWFLGIQMGMALVGIWLANSADEWIRGLLMLWRWNSGKWKEKSFV
ncbi:MAG: MATE family efflux transporter [Fusobacteriaceae bacterium]